jgi:mono/diheme cytochrome c family protein
MMQTRWSLAAILLILSIAAGAESANLKREDVEGDAEAGRALAVSVCGGCHAVSEDQSFASSDPPDFLTIANRPNVTAISLRHRIAMLPHTPSPGRMPNPLLTREELADVVAYIMSMRER